MFRGRWSSIRDIPSNTAKSKVELFVTKVKGFQSLASAKKRSILDFAVLLDMPLSFL